MKLARIEQRGTSVESSKNYDLTGVHGAEVFRNLPEGLTIKLTDGALAEIVGNPQDGAILMIKILDCPVDPSRVGNEEAVFYTEVKEVT